MLMMVALERNLHRGRFRSSTEVVVQVDNAAGSPRFDAFESEVHTAWLNLKIGREKITDNGWYEGPPWDDHLGP